MAFTALAMCSALGCTGNDPAGDPAITDASMNGSPSLEVRQGGHGTLELFGTGLDQISSVTLNPVSVSGTVPCTLSAASSGHLVADFDVPHGASAGSYGVKVLAGTRQVLTSQKVEVTVITVSPTGDDASRGTPHWPFRTLSHALSVSGEKDTVALKPGDYLGSLESFPRDTSGSDFPVVACNIPNLVTVTGALLDGGIGARILDDQDAGGIPLVSCGDGGASGLELDGFDYGAVLRGGFSINAVHVDGARQDGLLLLAGIQLKQDLRATHCGRAGAHFVGKATAVYGFEARSNGIGVRIEGGDGDLVGIVADDNLGAGLEFLGAGLWTKDNEFNRNGQGGTGAPGVLCAGTGRCFIANSEIADNLGDGVDAVGPMSLSVGDVTITGNRTGLWFASDAGHADISYDNFASGDGGIANNRGVGLRVGGGFPVAFQGNLRGNGLNLLVDPDFTSTVTVRDAKFDATDGGAFLDADRHGAELSNFALGGTLFIDDGGRTTRPFDWDADAGQGPFNYKLLSDAGSILF
jgi:hypothetical protein